MAYAPPPFSSEYDLSTQTAETDPSPRYQEGRYRDIWEHWAVVDRACQRVVEIQGKLKELEPELQAKTKQHEDLKEKSTKLFESLHGKQRSLLSHLPKAITFGEKKPKNESSDILRQEFEIAHKEETSLMTKLESLRERKNDLNKQLNNAMELASEVDQVFELLGASVATSNSESSPQLRIAEQNYANATTNLDRAQQTLTDLLRARVTVQNAHRYYNIVLKIMDAVRGTVLNTALGGFSEMSKNSDYKAAAETSGKAQVCFNETVRVLTPHEEMLPAEVLADFEKLKELELLQASKIYGFMYGWQHSTGGVRQSTETMLQRQEVVFACLTRLAVWVQNIVPVVEAELLTARLSRDRSRQDLVALWTAGME
ncbi:hypothetical protein K439DRAFT_496109 [Ramaria rubella]|nr:hypothetical protein K439DRAFT_496109 [Ramaria rubella]